MSRIIVAVTGSIAAYKSAELVRLLKKQGCEVQVVMTEHAQAFITPLTLQSLSGKPVLSQWCAAETQTGMDHIELARWPDKIICAPASANTIAKLAHGLADDLLTTLCLASPAPLFIAPAMNQQMWKNPATQNNIQLLQERGITIIGPHSGEQACGDIGLGRMTHPEEIIKLLLFTPQALLKNLRVLITAGPTQEHLDPVRYISNHSSGKMGFALAQAAKDAGAQVTLIAGPTHLLPPTGVTIISVTSAQEMHNAVLANIDSNNIFIGAAAVADYRPKILAPGKIKKTTDFLSIELEKNPDILQTINQLANKPFTVGFALETENLIQNAQQKLFNKNLNLIVANLVSADSGFNSDDNVVTLIDREANIETLGRADKKIIARQIIQKLASLYVSEVSYFKEEAL